MKKYKATTSGKLPAGIEYEGSSILLSKNDSFSIHKFKVTKAAIAQKYGLQKKRFIL